MPASESAKKSKADSSDESDTNATKSKSSKQEDSKQNEPKELQETPVSKPRTPSVSSLDEALKDVNSAVSKNRSRKSSGTGKGFFPKSQMWSKLVQKIDLSKKFHLFR